MKLEGIETKAAPAAIGPYRQAVVVGDLIYTSGQIAIDPDTQEFVYGDIRMETSRAMDSLRAVIEAGGSSMDRIAKVTIYLRDMNDYPAVNAIYSSYFSEGCAPAREAVQVAGLPKNARIEISAIAVKIAD